MICHEITVWYKRISDLITRICDIYNFKQIITDSFNEPLKVYYFNINNDDLIYTFHQKNDINGYELLMHRHFLEAILKGLGFKKYEVNFNTTQNVVLEINVSNFKIVTLIDNNNLITKLSVKDIVCGIRNENRSLDVKNYYHLILVSSDNNSILQTINTLNIVRLGGLKSEIIYDYKPSIDDIKKIYNSLYVGYVLDDKVDVFNIETNKNEIVNIKELYPYMIKKLKPISKCMSCKEKEEN